MKHHRLDVVSLVAGLLFATLSMLFALDQVDAISLDVRWVPAIVLLALGAAGILSNIVREQRARAAAERDAPA